MVCLKGCANRAKLDKSILKILSEVSADSYKEMKIHFNMLNRNFENEQNTLFAAVRFFLFE